LRDHPGHSCEARLSTAAHFGADGKSHEGRSREMPRGGRVRLPRETREYRTTAFRPSHVAASLRTQVTKDAADKVNILLVDDQHAKLLSHEAILAEIGE